MIPLVLVPTADSVPLMISSTCPVCDPPTMESPEATEITAPGALVRVPPEGTVTSPVRVMLPLHVSLT